MTEKENSNFSYLPVNETVSRLGLYLTGGGYDVIPPASKYPLQSHPELYQFRWETGRVLPEFQLLFISAGEGIFQSQQTGELKVIAGTAIMLFPDVWHRYRPSHDSGWTEHWISFGGDLMFQWFKRGLFRIDCPLTKVSNPESTLSIYRNLLGNIFNRDQSPEKMAAIAMSIIASTLNQPDCESGSQQSKNTINRHDSIVAKALNIIRNYSHQKVSVDMVAQHLQVTRRTLERHFRQERGTTILQELVSCRIQHASWLLRETRIPIKFVSSASGFSSLSNFCKVFRKETLMTPGKYRALSTKKNSEEIDQNHTVSAPSF